MKNFYLRKNNKKIKILLKDSGIISITGPLGTIDTYFPENFIKNNNCNFFILKNKLDFYLNKIKALFKSVSRGWYLELFLKGIGFRTFKSENNIVLDVGYSNLIVFKPSNHIIIKNFKNRLLLFSMHRIHLNNIISILKNYYRPDKYRGKGIFLKNESIKLIKKKS